MVRSRRVSRVAGECAESEETRARRAANSDEVSDFSSLPKFGSRESADVLDGEMFAGVSYRRAVGCIHRVGEVQDRCPDELSSVCPVFGSHGVRADIEVIVAGGWGRF